MQLRVMTKLFKLELISESRNYKTYLFPMIFYFMVMLLYPLAFGSNSNILQKYFPAMAWLGIMLAVILGLKSFFDQEYQKHILENLLFNRMMLIIFIINKTIVNWTLICIPLLVAVPVSALFFNQTTQYIFLLELSILLATPILFLLGMIFSSITFGISQKTLVKSILSMPLFIPVLILAVLLVTAQPQIQHIIIVLLIGILCCLSVIAPWFTALIIENGVYD